MFVCNREHLDKEIIELLLDCGANILQQDNDRLTLLDVALDYGHHHIVELCLSKFNDILKQNAEIMHFDFDYLNRCRRITVEIERSRKRLASFY